MSIVQRAKDILLDPKKTWPVIDAEPATVQSVYVPYVLALAAIPAVAGFIGLSIVGFGGAGVHVRLPIGSGIVNMIVSYALSLVMIYVMALVVDALAPTFGGQKNLLAALKLVAYGSTAAFVGGIFSLLPALSILGVLAAIYSIYLFYLGLPVLMRSPPEKSLVYTAAVVIAGIVVGFVLAALTSLLTPTPMADRMAGTAEGFGPTRLEAHAR